MARTLLLVVLVSQIGDQRIGNNPLGGGVPRIGESRLMRDAARPGSLLLDLYPGDPSMESGCHQLPETLCLNGTCVTPLLRYHGKDATTAAWSAWGYGPALTKQEVGADATPATATPFLRADQTSVELNAADYFQAGDTTSGEVETQDLIFELVYGYTDASGNDGIFGKKTNAGGQEGWQIIQGGSGNIVTIQMDDGADLVSVNSGTGAANAWHHYIGYMDRSGSGLIYTNGAAGSAVSISAGSSTLANSASFVIGTSSSGGRLEGRVACLTAWVHPDIGTHVQAANAMERFQRAAGVWARVSGGSKVATTLTRASNNYLRKQTAGVTTLFLTGNGWPRVERSQYATGYLNEGGVTNLALQSSDVTTSWTELDAGDTQSANGMAAPDGLTVADGNIADATDGLHGFSQAVTLTATTYVWSVYAKAGNQSWLYMDNTTVANATGYCNLATCGEGTKGAGADEIVSESLGGGWCRCGISFTGTAAAHTLRMASAQADGDNTIAGDAATVNTWFWGMQAEAGAVGTSQIPTTTSTVARAADSFVLSEVGNAFAPRGTLVCSSAFTPHNVFGAGNPTMMRLGNATNHVAASLAGNASDGIRCDVTSGGVGQAIVHGAPTFADGLVHTGACTWNTNDTRAWTDGVSTGTPDTAVTAPSSFNSIVVGAGLSPLTGQLVRCRVFDIIGVRQ